MKRSVVTITIIGGGVYVVPLLLELARTQDTPSLRVRLSARDHSRLAIIAGHAKKRIDPWAPNWDIRTFRSSREAVSGADVVVLLARIGGLQARAHDEAFPRLYGCVGDEGLGLGGLANAWRTLPVLESIARDIAAGSPPARVLNLMAPLPLTTRLLRELCIDAIGVCELPATVERKLRSATRLEYLGMNHLGWFWPATADDSSVLSNAVSRRLAHQETVESYGAIPLPYYYSVLRPELGRDLGVTAPTGRAHELMRFSRRILDRMVSGRDSEIVEYSLRKTPWFDHALIPILRSLILGVEHHGFVNTDRLRHVDVWPAETLLECRAVFAGFDVRLEPPRTIPPAVRTFLEQLGSVADRQYRACRTRSRSDLRLAVEAVGGVPADRVDDAIREVCRPVSPGMASLATHSARGS